MDASRFTILMGHQEQEEDMAINLLAIDIGKRSFHIFGVDQDGVIISRKVSRAKLYQTIEDLNRRRSQWRLARVRIFGVGAFVP